LHNRERIVHHLLTALRRLFVFEVPPGPLGEIEGVAFVRTAFDLSAQSVRGLPTVDLCLTTLDLDALLIGSAALRLRFP
jgi:hypothetical protein